MLGSIFFVMYPEFFFSVQVIDYDSRRFLRGEGNINSFYILGLIIMDVYFTRCRLVLGLISDSAAFGILLGIV